MLKLRAVIFISVPIALPARSAGIFCLYSGNSNKNMGVTTGINLRYDETRLLDKRRRAIFAQALGALVVLF